MAKNKKRSLKGLWITLIILGTLIIAPIVTLYGCFYENKTSTVVKDEHFDQNNLFYNIGVDALDNVKETGKIDFTISKDVFNQLLLAAFEDHIKTNVTIAPYISGLYIETKEDAYTLYVDLHYKNLFKTRAKIILTLSEEIIDGKEAFALNISDVKLGRISGILKMIPSMLTKYIPFLSDNSMIEGLLASSGLPLHSDISNKRIYFLKDEISQMLLEQYGNEGLLSGIFQELFSDDLFEGFQMKKDGLHALIDITSLGEYTDFTDQSKVFDVDWDSYKEKNISLIREGIISENQALDMYSFLLKGYDRSNADIKEMVNSLDLSSIGIVDTSNYLGVFTNTNEENKIPLSNKDFKDLAADNLNDIGTISSTKEILHIDEDDINSVFRACDIIGNSFMIDRYQKNDDIYSIIKNNTLTITNVYSNLVSTGLKIVIGVSINGFETVLCLDAKYSSFNSDDYSIRFDLKDNIYFGSRKADESFSQTIFELLESALNGIDTFSFDSNNVEMIISFENVINDSLIRPAIELIGTPACVLSGNTINEEGAFRIVLE